MPFALEALDTRKIGNPRRRQIAACHDAKASLDPWARVGAREPDCACFIELHRRDPGFETDVLPQVEPVGDVIQVSKDFELLGITVRQTPFLLQFVLEGIRVIKALDVTARARIAYRSEANQGGTKGVRRSNTR